jgi:hypothetical protein
MVYKYKMTLLITSVARLFLLTDYVTHVDCDTLDP